MCPTAATSVGARVITSRDLLSSSRRVKTGARAPTQRRDRGLAVTTNAFVPAGARIAGVGMALPKQALTNDDLSELVDTNDTWIRSRTGIGKRHVISGDESLTSLASEAALNALAMANVKPEDVDLIILATSSPGTCCISQIPPTVCQYKTDTFFLFISALPFRAPGGDFSAAALQGCGDVVRITVFDERPESPELGRGQYGGDRQYGTQASDGDVVTSKQYLGSIDIPVAALYKADGGKLEGLLPIELPPVMLGYDTGKQGGRGVSIQARPALSVYIQFNPALAKPEPVARDAGPGEEEALKRHAQNWEKDARSVGRHCKHRPFRAIATDAMGRSVHLSRYCSPTTLPPGFEGATADEATLRQLLRFTHLVPHVSDMDAFNLPPGVDIWTTTAEFLDMCAGDSEEHALLLLGFLLSLGVEAYIILGVSAADSDAAMVFTPGGQGRRPGQTPGSPPIYTPLLDGSLIWDPMAGTMFSAYDAAAGALMGEVAVVFNHTNIWANVGLGAKPHDMRWDLTDYTAWRPFFSQSTLPPRALPTRQRRVQYTSFEPGFYERLAAAVEREAMDAIVKTRQRQHTPFNRRASRALKELLLSWSRTR